jgi:NitT/TauT family transport system permease protein
MVWELAAREGMLPAYLLPAPGLILRAEGEMIASGQLFADVGATLGRVCAGLLIGGGMGLLVGLAVGWSKRVQRVVAPFVAAAHPIPKIAVLPLIMLFFGTGETTKIVVASLAAFFPMALNAHAGVKQISPVHFEVAQAYGASRRTIFWRVVIPGSMPSILAGVLLAFNITLLLTVAVEMVSVKAGLGSRIWYSWQMMQVEDVFAVLFTITLIGIAANLILQRASTILAPWQQARAE